jgi:hypothetical protein
MGATKTVRAEATTVVPTLDDFNPFTETVAPGTRMPVSRYPVAVRHYDRNNLDVEKFTHGSELDGK